MPFMKTGDRNTLAKNSVVVPKKRKLRDVRDYIIPTGGKASKAYVLKPKVQPEPDINDYIIPTGWKRKRNISGNIDKILYGAK